MAGPLLPFITPSTMHHSSKLGPALRKQIYDEWCKTLPSLRSLGRNYHVDKNVIKTVIDRGKVGDFSLHKSANERFRTVVYGLSALRRTEQRLRKKQERQARRYEKDDPGEMVHGDTKRLPRLTGETKLDKKEVLYVSIDDCTRILVADILPGQHQEESSAFLCTTVQSLPFQMADSYTDNGKEYRGNPEKHLFMRTCSALGITQHFTRVYTPQTNGKAERVIKTIMEEWHRKHHFTSREERRASLQEFVHHYNHHRPHMGINGLTPMQKLSNYYSTTLQVSGDNA